MTNNRSAPRDEIGQSVLRFYRRLPFNMVGSQASDIELIRRSDLTLEYFPPLAEHLHQGARVLEVGSGTGWLSNAMALHHRVDVLGIDFNRVAVQHARQIATALQSGALFEVANLFEFRVRQPYDVVVSNGVMHHTGDCLGALERVFSEMVRPGGRAFIGLYHAYGRAPFIQHFEGMRRAGATEQQMLERYSQLHANFNDPTHLLSWFRDQVCHPHETHHTLAELLPLLRRTGMRLESTSINRFASFNSVDEILTAEAALQKTGRERLAQNVYFPGFFVFMARKVES